MKPYYEHAGIIIYHGDCRDVLPTLAEQFDLILTDPPYGEVNRPSNGLRSLDKGIADIETVPPLEIIRLVEPMAKSFYFWCGTEQISVFRAALASTMSTRMCFWEKTNPSPMNGEHIWLSSVECCVFGRKPKAFFGEFCKSPVWRGPICKDQRHPTEKPTWLFRHLILASSPDSGSVLDPFMGSGSTLEACKACNRRAVGIEIEERYCEIAAKRLSQEVLDFQEATA